MKPFRSLAAVVAVGLAAVVFLGAAQDRQSPPSDRSVQQAEEDNAHEMRIYALKHASAEEAVHVLSSLIGGFDGRMTIDPRTNSILVQARPDTHEQFAALLGEIDVPVQEAGDVDVQLRIFDVRDLTTRISLEKLVPVLVSGRHDRVAFEGNGLMLVSGAPETIDRVTRALHTLREQQANHIVTDSRRLRVVWLVDPGEFDFGGDIPGDLSDVVAELEGLGINGLRLASQSIVEVKSGNDFDARSTVMLNTPFDLSVRGMFQLNADGDSELEILIGAASGPTQSAIESTITCPTGHSVVLGATPMGTMQSVFVVQISE